MSFFPYFHLLYIILKCTRRKPTNSCTYIHIIADFQPSLSSNLWFYLLLFIQQMEGLMVHSEPPPNGLWIVKGSLDFYARNTLGGIDISGYNFVCRIRTRTLVFKIAAANAFPFLIVWVLVLYLIYYIYYLLFKHPNIHIWVYDYTFSQSSESVCLTVSLDDSWTIPSTIIHAERTKCCHDWVTIFVVGFYNWTVRRWILLIFNHFECF